MIASLYRQIVPQKARDVIYKVFLGKFLYEIRLRRHAMDLLRSEVDNVPEKRRYIKYVRRHFFGLKSLQLIFPSPFIEKYIKMNPDVYYDSQASLYYTMMNGKRLYWKSGMKPEEIKDSFSRLQAEQDSSSPHRYFEDGFDFKDKVLFDAGAAEGIVVLNHIEEISHAYLFECDEGWSMALTQTFKPYQDKVTVISKYVSDRSSDTEICIDDFVQQNNVMPDIVKMDIEGYEECALCGAGKTLTEHHPFVTCCLYHLPEAEEKIVERLSSIGYKCEVLPYYMYCIAFSKTGAPYLRHGIVRASK